MIKPWYVGPVLGAVAVAASAYWWHTEKERWNPPQARRPDPAYEGRPAPVQPRLARRAIGPALLGLDAAGD